MPKPGTGRFNGRFAEVLISKLKAIGLRRRHRRLRNRSGCRVRPASRDAGDPIGCLQSAHRPAAFTRWRCFRRFPPLIGVPILVTQHLPAPFMSVFARQLGIAARREALVAEDGMRLFPDRILIAPGDAHLTIEPVQGGHVVKLVREGRPAAASRRSIRCSLVGRSEFGSPRLVSS
jgi:two-component system, chemotaxis family, protein-glutamate methylesterase/glutaminase